MKIARFTFSRNSFQIVFRRTNRGELRENRVQGWGETWIYTLSLPDRNQTFWLMNKNDDSVSLWLDWLVDGFNSTHRDSNKEGHGGQVGQSNNRI